jgi:hypothetical protein
MLLLEVSKALLKRLQTPKHVALGGKVLTGISLFVPLVKLFLREILLLGRCYLC